ncbi:membrane-bound PQQ-dependent dehydrogenase, glucose/quinate/shikimate family [Comamonas sp. J-3]|uniref:membrane-bound PQQ-dependent dehydrogenase, glucose/quinate/shikimate family n=1 Tax=Comamonas trifloxystrobinivorans TaxID=3350256 RepID=UPI003727B9A1
MSNPDNNARSPWWPRAFGVVLALVGLALAIGGVRLATLGGSWYYLIAGVVTLASGVLLLRAKALGGALYLLVVIGTALWALAEVGTSFWGLVPRLAPVLVLGLIAALALRSLSRGSSKIALPGALLQALVLLAGAASLLTPHGTVENNAKLGAPAKDFPVVSDAKSEANRWTQYGRDADSTRFAPFDQIKPENVNQLEVAWTYRTGAQTGGGNEDQNTPIQVGDSVYLCTPQNKVIALNAETGAEKWVFDPQPKENKWWSRCRGVAYYELPEFKAAKSNGSEPQACEARIITSDKQGRLWALDAKTGEVCQSFGDTGKGYTDLSKGMGEYPDFYYMPTSQPLVAGDRVIIGGWVWDGKKTNQPSGVVRAFSLKDGSLEWAWDLGNASITKLPEDGKTYTNGTPNFWSSGAYDDKLGLIYLPLGNATPDFWGAHRTEDMNKYSTTVVALKADSGREAWHFQSLRMDTWDYDNGTPPTLVDVPNGDGTTKPGLVLATKTHQLFLLDRSNGQPLANVEERPAPQTTMQGDAPASPTQPWSAGMPQVAKMELAEKDMWGATMFDQLYCRIQFKQLRYEGPYTKMTEQMTLIYPGYYGGFNWGGHSYDKRSGLLIVNDMVMPQIGFLHPQEGAKEKLDELKKNDITNASWGSHLQEGTPYQSIRGAFNSFLGLPCHQPSWGNLTAIDMQSKQIAWQVPLGTVEDSKLHGVRFGLPVPVGMPSLSGPFSTAGGLTFYAGTQDYYLRAFDNQSGKELWKGRLPVGAQATPMTYLSPESGRQFVVVSAGGARMTADKGDYVIAYALPKK